MYLDAAQLAQVLLLSQSLLFGLYLLRRRGPWPLAALLLVLATHMAGNLLFERRPAVAWPPLTPALGFVYGPLILALTRELGRPPRGPRPSDAWHLLPAVAVALGLAASRAVPAWLGLLAFASVAAYLALSFRTIAAWHRRLDATRSDAARLRLAWLRQLLVLLLVLLATDFVRFLAREALPDGWRQALYALQIGGVFVFVNALIYRALRQPTVLDLALDLEPIADVMAGGGPPAAPPLDTALHARVLAAMERDRHWLEPELTVAELADRVGCTARQLSRVINQGGGTNFNDFVNAYRVAAVKRRLADAGDERKLLAVLHDCGFNSKSTFNAAFKRATGETPSAFRRRGRPAT